MSGWGWCPVCLAIGGRRDPPVPWSFEGQERLWHRRLEAFPIPGRLPVTGTVAGITGIESWLRAERRQFHRVIRRRRESNVSPRISILHGHTLLGASRMIRGIQASGGAKLVREQARCRSEAGWQSRPGTVTTKDVPTKEITLLGLVFSPKLSRPGAPPGAMAIGRWMAGTTGKIRGRGRAKRFERQKVRRRAGELRNTPPVT
jgi:hypothetical protein